MGSDPEELLRSIERTREELALTVDTIAGRLDPKFVAKRGVGKLRDGVTGVVDGVKARFDHRADHADHVPDFDGSPVGGSTVETGSDDGGERGYRADKAIARASSAIKNVPKPAIGGGLAALVALAAVLYAANRRQRR
jgi:hypothetical protein